MSLAHELRVAMEQARAETLHLLADVDDVEFVRQAHPDFSPLGWHLGHIGVTESFWILQQCKREPTIAAFYDYFFTPTDNPKPNRIHLPPRHEILAYLETVRTQVFSFLTDIDFEANHPLLYDGGVFYMLLQHEEQHNETIVLIKQLLRAGRQPQGDRPPGDSSAAVSAPLHEESRRAHALSRMERVPEGLFFMGSDDRSKTLDNERPRHEQWVDAFNIDRFPVTNAEYARFVAAGGYRQRSLWSEAGWRWRERCAVEHPFYWRWTSHGWCENGLSGAQALVPEQTVMCVSWYEADAYARFVGKRLPTEAEWEKAAALNFFEQWGQVWEWTSTWFAPYPGFVAHPYEGYSVPYFDQQHRVLRGGSWATRSHVKRITFRNWYRPWTREIFVGLRCAEDV